ncbi:MAG: hypothetical protein ACLPZR_08435 [Solirubrobacteraceae bacterium]
MAGASAAKLRASAGVSYPPIGALVDTLVIRNSSGLRAIQIGSNYYDTNDVADELVLRRSNLTVVANNLWYGPGAAARALNDIQHRSSSDIVVLAAGPTAPGDIPGNWSKVFKLLGATAVGDLSHGDWSAIGLPGRSSGGWSNSQGAIQGYFQHDRVGPYSFVPRERIGVDLDAPGAPSGQNIIRVGSTTYPSGPLYGSNELFPAVCGTGGFQVLPLSALTLAPTSLGHKTFATDGCGMSNDTAAEEAMISYLQQVAASGSRLIVLIQSIGPTLRSPYTDASLWLQLDGAVAGVGGTPTVLDTDTGSYSLIGSVGIPSFPLAESSQTALGLMSGMSNPPAAHETAVLKRNTSYLFEPGLSSPSGRFRFGFTTTIYRPPQSFGDTVQQQNALAYISLHVLKLPWPVTAKADFCYDPPAPDVRYAYCYKLMKASEWMSAVDELRGTPYPASAHPNFSAQDWSKVVNQLAGPGYDEFKAVAIVKGIFASIISAKNSNVPATLAVANSEAKDIQQALADSAQQKATGLWVDLLAGALNLTGAVFADDAIAGPINIMAGSMYLAEDGTGFDGGDGPLSTFSVRAADFEQGLAAAYQTTTANLMHLSDIVLTDPDKLRAFYQHQQSFLYVENAKVDAAIRLSAAQFTYQSLLPPAYEFVRLVRSAGANQGITDARNYVCAADDALYYPFPDAQPSAQLLNSTLNVLVQRGAALPDDRNYITPPTPLASLTDRLFEPYAASGGVITQFGLYKPWFYRQAYNASTGQISVDC